MHTQDFIVCKYIFYIVPFPTGLPSSLRSVPILGPDSLCSALPSVVSTVHISSHCPSFSWTPRCKLWGLRALTIFACFPGVSLQKDDACWLFLVFLFDVVASHVFINRRWKTMQCVDSLLNFDKHLNKMVFSKTFWSRDSPAMHISLLSHLINGTCFSLFYTLLVPCYCALGKQVMPARQSFFHGRDSS